MSKKSKKEKVVADASVARPVTPARAALLESFASRHEEDVYNMDEGYLLPDLV